MMKDDRKSRGCGFVTFRDSESAEKVVNELNGKKLPHRKVSKNELNSFLD